jgi:hypothetical protein
MRYLGILALAAFVFGGIGCSKSGSGSGQQVGCSVETVVTTAAAGAIASADSCENVSQIQQDIQAKLGSINLCQSAAVQQQMTELKKKQGDKYKGIVGSIVCPLATDGIISLIGAGVPSSWGCKGNSDIAAAISAACVAVVPI